MTHLPDITPEQALAVLLKGAKLQQAPVSRTPRPLEAIVGIGKDNHAIVAIQQELGVPARYIGLGEGAEDFAAFDSKQFVEELL